MSILDVRPTHAVRPLIQLKLETASVHVRAKEYVARSHACEATSERGAPHKCDEVTAEPFALAASIAAARCGET